MYSKLSQASGFSLIEVMIAITISMGLLYGVSSMMTFNARTTKSIELSGDFNSLVSTIQTIINNESSCKTVFSGKSFTASVVGQIDPGTSSSLPSLASLELNGLKIAEVGQPPTGLKITKIEFDKIENVLPDVTVAGVLNKQYMVNLHLEAEKIMSGGVSAVGGSQKNANFKFSILVDSGKVTGCYGGNSVTESVSQTCVALGGTFANGTCTLTPKVDASTVCTAANLGAFRYSVTKDSMEYCSATGWKSVGGASVDGRCNNGVAGGCISGLPFEDNANSTCGTTRTWRCAGENSGTTSPQCSFSNLACPGGVCNNSSPGACTTGTPVSDSANTNCGQIRSWYCQTSGGQSGQCAYTNAACLPTASPVDCIGSWLGCSTTCGPGTQEFSITQDADGGKLCDYKNKDIRDCKPENAACPVPVWNESGWSDCKYPKTGLWVTCSDAHGMGSHSQTVKCVQGSVVLLDAECLKTAPKPAELQACKNNSGCKTCKNNCTKVNEPHGTTVYNLRTDIVAATFEALPTKSCYSPQRYVSCPNTTSFNYDGCYSAPWAGYTCKTTIENKMSTCFNGAWGTVTMDPSATTVRYGVARDPIGTSACIPWL